MSNCPNQSVTQTVTVNVNDGSCSGGGMCPSTTYATQAQLTSSIAGVYVSIGDITGSTVMPSDLSTLSTTIGSVSNIVTDLETDFYNLVNVTIPELEQGISSLSTAIATISPTASADISTIRPLYSSLLFDLSSIKFANSTNITGSVRFVDGLLVGTATTYITGNSVTTPYLNALNISSPVISSLQSTVDYLLSNNAAGPVDLNGANISYSNGAVNITENGYPLWLISTAEKTVSTVHTSNININITPSLRSMEILLAGADGPSYIVEDGSPQPVYGGKGAWVHGRFDILPAMYGSTLELSIPSSLSNYVPTSLRIVEGDIPLIYAGNGGGAAKPGPATNVTQILGGGDAGALGSNATDGVSGSYDLNVDTVDYGVSSLTIWISSGTGASTSADGIGGSYFANEGDILPNGVPFDVGNNNSPGSNGLNHTGGLGSRGAGNATFSAGGDGGGGYYAGGGGAMINTANDIDPTVNYSTSIFAAGGGGGTSYYNPSYITLTGSGLNDGSQTILTTNGDAAAFVNYTTNLQTLYGSIRLIGTNGNFIDINNL